MNYLGLTDIKPCESLPRGYDSYWWISPSFVNGIEYCKSNNLRYNVLKSNWEDDKDIETSMKYLMELHSKVLMHMIPWLNRVHNVNFSIRSWNILVGQWLYVFIVSYYDKYLQFQRLNKTNLDFECHIYEDSPAEPPIDYIDYLDMTNDDDYNRYLYSRLFWSIKEKSPLIHGVLIGRYTNREPVFRKRTIGYYKIKIYRRLIRLYKCLSRSNDIVVLQDSYFPFGFLVRMMLKGRGKVSNYVVDYYRNERTRLRMKPKWDVRESFGSDDEGDCFSCFLLKKVYECIPKAYLEGLSYLVAESKKTYRHAMKAKTILYSAEGIDDDELFKVYLMQMRNRRCTLRGIQHGGNYGIDRFPDMINEYNICDVFYTWGWSLDGEYRCKFQPMPSPKLMNMSTISYKGKEVLYVGKSYSKYLSRLERNRINYHKIAIEEVRFFDLLDETIKKNMRVRLYPIKDEWNLEKSFKKNTPYLRIDNNRTFYESLNTARIVVATELSTSVIEALCVNKPVIFCRSLAGIEKKSLSILQKLLEVGVLVETIDDLRIQLEIVYENVEKWWNESKRKQVVNEFIGLFAFNPKESEIIWEKEIMSYLHQ